MDNNEFYKGQYTILQKELNVINDLIGQHRQSISNMENIVRDIKKRMKEIESKISVQCFLDMKKRFPDAVILARCGDFYESYMDDAKVLNSVLKIALTKSEKWEFLAGFPFHSLDDYLPKLIRAGYRVVICDQF